MEQDLKLKNELSKSPIQSDKETGSSQYTISADDYKGLKIEDVDKRIEAAKVEVLRDAQIKINEQIQISQASYITVFGIFASITSFLTIEFQFLKTLDNVYQILGFSIVLFALLFGFNIALDHLVKNRLDKEVPAPRFTWFVMVLFFCGVALVCSDAIKQGLRIKTAIVLI